LREENIKIFYILVFHCAVKVDFKVII